MKKKVVIVTDIDFWIDGAGHRSRLRSLIIFLSQHTDLTIFYVKQVEEKVREYLFCVPVKFNFIDVKHEGKPSLKNLLNQFKKYMSSNTVDVCLIEFFYLEPLLKFIPKKIKTLLDAHDLFSEKNKNFEQANIPLEFKGLTRDQEFSIFSKFHKVILIQEEEYQLVKNVLGEEKVLLVPHSVYFPQKRIRKEVKNIGFVASEYRPNIEGLLWFTTKVWPRIDNNSVTFNVYGRINLRVNLKQKGIVLKGFVSDLNRIYEETDIIINPVHLGAGLKIKNIEALGNGLPLVTTSHGASGLRSQANISFLVADKENDFAMHINQLVNDYPLRKKLGNNAYKFARRNFLPQFCYAELLEEIYK